MCPGVVKRSNQSRCDMIQVDAWRAGCVMPIQNWNGFQMAVGMANTVIPQHFPDVLESVKGNDEEVRELAMETAQFEDNMFASHN